MGQCGPNIIRSGSRRDAGSGVQRGSGFSGSHRVIHGPTSAIHSVLYLHARLPVNDLASYFRLRARVCEPLQCITVFVMYLVVVQDGTQDQYLPAIDDSEQQLYTNEMRDGTGKSG